MYPQIGESNDGEHSKVGLNENLTQYAAAIAYDFAKGNFEKCAKHYSEILLLAPENVYTVRNLGLVKMRDLNSSLSHPTCSCSIS